MDLLERYLQAVRFFLPRQQQDDIVRELSENLVSEMEDRQEACGRPLSEDEQADILRRHGHPMLVAGRYQARQHLIGPTVFPFYTFALKVGLGICLLVTVLLAVVAAVLSGDPVRRLLEALLGYPGRAVVVFGWTTLGFAAIDYTQARLQVGRTWDPRTLPRLVRPELRASRARASFELLVTTAALVWLLLVPQAPHLLLAGAASFLELAPVWRTVYVPIVLLTAVAAALSLTTVLRPYWTPARSLVRIAMQAGGLVVVGILFRAGPWIAVRPGAALPHGASIERLLDVINKSCEIGLAITAFVTVIEIGREVYRLAVRHRAALRPDSARAGLTQ